MERHSRNQQIIDGELEDNQVMMHLEKGKYFGLNPVGKRIWDFIEEPKGFDEIIKHLLEKFDVTEEQCKNEVSAFLMEAISKNIIEKGE